MAKGKQGKRPASASVRAAAQPVADDRPHCQLRSGVESRLQEAVRRIDWKLLNQQINWLSQQTSLRSAKEPNPLGEGLLNLLAELEHAAEQDGLKPPSSS